MTRTDIINALIQKNGYKTYLEIGVDNMHSYDAINVETKECCDPFFSLEGELLRKYGSADNLPPEFLAKVTYRLTSDEMFATNNKTYDIIFIDGYHEEMQTGRDIINSLKHLNPGGIIVIHDCLPVDEGAQIMPRSPGTWMGNVWKTIPKLSSQGIVYRVVNTDYGCGLIKYHPNADKLKYFEEPSQLTWQDLINNSDALMHIISLEDFQKQYLS